VGTQFPGNEGRYRAFKFKLNFGSTSNDAQKFGKGGTRGNFGGIQFKPPTVPNRMPPP